MTVYAQDNFTRADNASSWGTSTGPNSGQVWSHVRGSITVSISTNRGEFASGSATTQVMSPGNDTRIDTDQVCVVSESSASTGDSIGLCSRFVDSSNMYLGRLTDGTAATIYKVSSGTFTQLSTSSFTWAASTAYRIRFQTQGTNLRLKVWIDGNSEPGSWTTTATDSTFSSAAKYGPAGAPSGGNIFFTFYQATDIASTTSHVLMCDGYGGVFS